MARLCVGRYTRCTAADRRRAVRKNKKSVALARQRFSAQRSMVEREPFIQALAFPVSLFKSPTPAMPPPTSTPRTHAIHPNNFVKTAPRQTLHPDSSNQSNTHAVDASFGSRSGLSISNGGLTSGMAFTTARRPDANPSSWNP